MEVAGIEPETLCAESPVSMQDSEFSVEALTEILTKISGSDRQMLARIVERWGSLSDELKRADEALAEKPVFFYPSISLL